MSTEIVNVNVNFGVLHVQVDLRTRVRRQTPPDTVAVVTGDLWWRCALLGDRWQWWGSATSRRQPDLLAVLR
jgi:hypothetical protein